MSTSDRRPSIDRREPEADSALSDLFAHAAPREQPPEIDATEIRRAVYAEWDAVTGRRVLLRRIGTWAAAAAVVGAAVLLTVGTEPTAPRATVAQVERLVGTVQIVAGGATTAVHVGDAIAAGATLATGSGQVALRLAAGGSLRVAPQTRLTLTAANSAALEAGALYFDSEGASPRGDAFAVVTAHGTLRDVGTQFVATVDTARLEVGVRDGRVALTRGTASTAVATGERITVGNSAEVVRESLPTFGRDWAWAERLAPPFDIDGRRLVDFLEWVADQTGRTLAFADPAVERVARETVLNGSIDLEPVPKLMAVLTLTDLDCSIEGARLLITPK
jgi:ferric-dicitrate binding protein FerR (iron transport regulator)